MGFENISFQKNSEIFLKILPLDANLAPAYIGQKPLLGMKSLAIIVSATLVASILPFAYAEAIPSWIKNNAGWWADGSISEFDFVQGIQYLISEGVLVVPPTEVSEQTSGGIPDWVKNNAGWWAEGVIGDDDFINGIQYLMSVGVISVTSTEGAMEKSKDVTAEFDMLQAELEECQSIKKAYDRLNCEKVVKLKIKAYEYKQTSKVYQVGPLNFYNPGVDFEITGSGQAHLTINWLAENTSPSETITMMCTGPAVCNYDVWDGSKAFKYASTDFTNGAHVLKPGELKEFNIFFGPNIGYGGTKFEYDASKDYFFRISEPWGSAQIPLELG